MKQPIRSLLLLSLLSKLQPINSLRNKNKISAAFSFVNTRNLQTLDHCQHQHLLHVNKLHHQTSRPYHRTSSLQMCQLMGMNCAALTDFSFSFSGFTKRGGETDIHSHGWGLCTYEGGKTANARGGGGLRSFHESDPASESLLAKFLMMHPVKTLNMVAHIRYATRGEVSMENVHPFQREIWGQAFCFAHNGDVAYFDPKNFAKNQRVCGSCEDDDSDEDATTTATTFSTTSSTTATTTPCVKIPWIGRSIGVKDNGERPYNPIGTTDSEVMFCAILNALRARFDTMPSLPVLHGAISSLCDEIVALDSSSGCGGKGGGTGTTILNFLMGCGSQTQFAYSWPGKREGSTTWNGLHYILREPPFGKAQLSDCDISIDFSTVTNEEDRMAVIATKPLTRDEEWVEIKRGELILFEGGYPVQSSSTSLLLDEENNISEGDIISLEMTDVEDKMMHYNVAMQRKNRSAFARLVMESVDIAA